MKNVNKIRTCLAPDGKINRFAYPNQSEINIKMNKKVTLILRKDKLKLFFFIFGIFMFELNLINYRS